ncbi:hypothetical protein CHUAL_008891 [Chamberlinius hualienensis]
MVKELLNKFIDESPVSAKLWEETVKECTKHNNQTLVEGVYKDGDICLRKTYMKVGHDRLKRVHRYVEHPTDGVSSDYKIHAVLAYDHFSDGKDRGAKIIEGGIGQKHMKIELESKAGRGIEFTVIFIGQ